MPHLDGFEAARLINNILASTYVILMHNEGDSYIETDDAIFKAQILKSKPESDLIAQIYNLVSFKPENQLGKGIP
jgi:hypothetical protein